MGRNKLALLHTCRNRAPGSDPRQGSHRAEIQRAFLLQYVISRRDKWRGIRDAIEALLQKTGESSAAVGFTCHKTMGPAYCSPTNFDPHRGGFTPLNPISGRPIALCQSLRSQSSDYESLQFF